MSRLMNDALFGLLKKLPFEARSITVIGALLPKQEKTLASIFPESLLSNPLLVPDLKAIKSNQSEDLVVFDDFIDSQHNLEALLEQLIAMLSPSGLLILFSQGESKESEIIRIIKNHSELHYLSLLASLFSTDAESGLNDARFILIANHERAFPHLEDKEVDEEPTLLPDDDIKESHDDHETPEAPEVEPPEQADEGDEEEPELEPVEEQEDEPEETVEHEIEAIELDAEEEIEHEALESEEEIEIEVEEEEEEEAEMIEDEEMDSDEETNEHEQSHHESKSHISKVLHRLHEIIDHEHPVHFDHHHELLEHHQKLLSSAGSKLKEHASTTSDLINQLSSMKKDDPNYHSTLHKLKTNHETHKALLSKYREALDAHKESLSSFTERHEETLEKSSDQETKFHQLVEKHKTEVDKHEAEAAIHELCVTEGEQMIPKLTPYR